MFTKAEYDALNEQQKEAIQASVYILIGDDESSKITHDWTDDNLEDVLDILFPCMGCVPDGYVENLEDNIIKKFRGVYAAARDLAIKQLLEQKANTTNIAIYVVVQPSTQGCSQIVVHDDNLVYASFSENAWNFSYTTLQDLADDILKVTNQIVAKRNSITKKEQQ